MRYRIIYCHSRISSIRCLTAPILGDISDEVIGVRTPILRKYAKTLYKENRMLTENFLKELPHRYFEENQLHAFLLGEVKDFEECLQRVSEFLPYINNWETCDQMAPKVLAKNCDRVLPSINKWIRSSEPYTVRYAIEFLMNCYLDERYDNQYTDMVVAVQSEEYYVKMMIAWYMATALAKQYTKVLPYIERRVLPEWTHRKAIRKACESLRITPEQKEYLRSLK